MAHTGPHPVKIRYVSDDLHCTVQRTVAHSIRCPRCGEKKVKASPQLARLWLYAHDCQDVPE